MLPDVRGVDVDLERIAVGVIEVERLRHLMVHRMRFDAVRLEVCLRLAQLVEALADLECYVKEPRRLRRR